MVRKLLVLIAGLILFTLQPVLADQLVNDTQDLSKIINNAYLYEDQFNGIKIKVYLLKKDQTLASSYIEYTKNYLREYVELLGDFPYEELNIMETNSPVGMSYPKYIVFGSAVIRLPFILTTSLPHEIVHQWFGAEVDIDYSSGNWAEGLTTYLSDYLLSEKKGKAAEYRKRLLLDYRNYVTREDEITLSEFKARKNDLTKAIGYGKSAMLFHMLRRDIGDEAFFKALRLFIKENKNRKASWADLEKAFESTTGQDLSAFFEQWLNRKGAIEITPVEASVVFRDGKYRVDIRVKQKTKEPFSFYLPVKAVTKEAERDFTIKVDKKDFWIRLSLEERPREVILDPEYDLFRIPLEDEVPPLVSAVKNDVNAIVVYPEARREIYRDIIEYYEKIGTTVVSDSEVRIRDLNEDSFVVLSSENRVFRMVFDAIAKRKGDFYVKVFKNPLNKEKVLMLIDAADTDAVKASFKKIKHYGNYSELAFENGHNILKSTEKTEQGIIIDFRSDFRAIRPEDRYSIDDIIDRIKDRRVVFVGEDHTNYAHHIIQYEIIRRLYEYNKNLLIGMEMFQRPYQKFLDQYIKGEITEKEFLKKTEYFKRWAYDYNLYRDIIQFARAKGIPIIALNIRKEIIDKVSKKGIDSLTEEEKKALPDGINMKDRAYREYLKRVFSRHGSRKGRSFDNFYYSQLLWDETMASTIVSALKNHPDAQMVVIAGNGHVRNAWGVPGRIERRGIKDYTILLTASQGGQTPFDKGVADYVFYTEWMDPPESVRLGVFLQKTDDGIKIERVAKGGPASKAGVPEGVYIVEIDGIPVIDIEDIKIALIDKVPGDRIKLKIKRRVLLFEKEEEVEVEL